MDENERRARANLQMSKRVDPDLVLSGKPAPPSPAPDENTANEATAIGIVARGRTLHLPIPGERRSVGWDPNEKKTVYAAVTRGHGPGERVELPVSEIKRLQGLGFLVDPDRIVAASAAVTAGAGGTPHQPEFATLPRR